MPKPSPTAQPESPPNPQLTAKPTPTYSRWEDLPAEKGPFRIDYVIMPGGEKLTPAELLRKK